MRDRDRDRRPSREDRGAKKKFQYRKRDASNFTEQANQKGGNWDRTYKGQFKVLRVEVGKSYNLRILPPTWDDPQHFAYDRYQHSGVGPDNQRYNCLRHHKNGPCPVCEEEAELKRDSQQESDPREAKALSEAAYKAKAKLRKVMWVIDRNSEKDGPQIWDPSWTVNRDLAARCVNERTGEVLYIDDPDDGYDISFKTEKKGQYSEIIGLEVARKSTPLSDDRDQQDEWLDFVQENPIPETFFFYDYDHIAKALSGGKVKRDDEDEAEEDKGPRTRSERRGRDKDEEEEEAPRSRRSSLRDADEDDDKDYDEMLRRGKRQGKEDLDEDDELDEPKVRSRRSRDDEDVEDGDEDEDDQPRSRRRRDDDDDDEEGGSHGKELRKVSRGRSASDEEREGSHDKPSARRDSDRDERSDRRAGKSRSRTEDDEDEREDRSDRLLSRKRSRPDDDDID